MWSYNRTDELYHFGVLGMKWGVRRSNYKQRRSERLRSDMFDYEEERDNYAKKAESVHVKHDIERKNRKSFNKMSRYQSKADKYNKEAANTDEPVFKAKLKQKALDYEYKISELKIKSDQVTKAAGYGRKSLKLLKKSNEFGNDVEKIKLRLAKDATYTEILKRKITTMPPEKLQIGIDYAKRFGVL